MKLYNLLLCSALTLAVIMALPSCKKETCSDGVQNQTETGVDCGGPCTACASCTDGIQNQDETGVDCGGSCTACPTCTDGIQNQGETGVDCGGPCTACPPAFTEHITATIDGVDFAAQLVAGSSDGDTIFFQSDQSQERQLFFKIPANVGTAQYDMVNDGGFNFEYKKLFDGPFTTTEGAMEVTLHNTTDQLVGGTFSATVVKYDFGVPVDTIKITEGSFGVEY